MKPFGLSSKQIMIDAYNKAVTPRLSQFLADHDFGEREEGYYRPHSILVPYDPKFVYVTEVQGEDAPEEWWSIFSELPDFLDRSDFEFSIEDVIDSEYQIQLEYLNSAVEKFKSFKAQEIEKVQVSSFEDLDNVECSKALFEAFISFLQWREMEFVASGSEWGKHLDVVIVYNSETEEEVDICFSYCDDTSKFNFSSGITIKVRGREMTGLHRFSDAVQTALNIENGLTFEGNPIEFEEIIEV